MHKVILLAILTLSIHACELPEDYPVTSQPVYFEYNYINYAWGYHNKGWIIDEEGNVRAYNLPEAWMEPDSTGYIQEEDLLFNISQTDSVIGVVDSTVLIAKAALIPGAKDGKISKQENTAFDAGSAVLSAYYYDAEEEAYIKVFLAMSGDFSSQNESREAKKLVSWLRSFGVFWL